MSASILYKFRSSNTFEALPLPGSSARLFDVKKAIVLAKKLDQAGSMDFEFSLRDATTNEEYTDESMLLPRGTRLIVQRLPASRGHGFLSRMARNPYGTATGPPSGHVGAAPMSSAPSDYYTIDASANADEDEFVSSSTAAGAAATTSAPNDEEKELAALRAATDAGRSDMRLHVSSGGGGGFRPPPPPGSGGGGPRGNNTSNDYVPRQRPNADPELREQEKSLQPKKQRRGIARTFQGDGTTGDEPLLQPSAVGFAELLNRGGGQSENASESDRLEYALKVTATSVPPYLQCALTHKVATDAVMIPWAGHRTVSDSAYRRALTENGFRCPLTGQEGVSPDDIVPNPPIRQAAEEFIKGVMEKMDEINKTQLDDDEDVDFTETGTSGNTLEGDDAETGVIVSKKMQLTSRKKQEEDDPFADEDDFGGDVFAVGVDKKPEASEDEAQEAEEEKAVPAEPVVEAKKQEVPVEEPPKTNNDQISASPKQISTKATESTSETIASPTAAGKAQEPSSSRRERRRGPPVGYTMGPAGGAAMRPRDDSFSPRDRDYGGRGRGRQDRPGHDDRYGREDPRDSDRGGETASVASDRDRHDDRDRGTKRPRSGSEYDEPPPEDEKYNRRDRPFHRQDDRRGDFRNQDFRGARGGGRGGYGRFNDRGGFRGRGGRRGGFRGRGRY